MRESPRIPRANCGRNEPAWVWKPKSWRKRPDYALSLHAEPQGLGAQAGWGQLHQDFLSQGRDRNLSSSGRVFAHRSTCRPTIYTTQKNPSLFPDWHLLVEGVGTKYPSQYTTTFKDVPATSSFMKCAALAEGSRTPLRTPPCRDATCMLMLRVFVHSLAASTGLRQFPWCRHGALALHLHLSAFPTHPPRHNMLLTHPERSAIVMMISARGRQGGRRVKRWDVCSHVRGNRRVCLRRHNEKLESFPSREQCSSSPSLFPPQLSQMPWWS